MKNFKIIENEQQFNKVYLSEEDFRDHMREPLYDLNKIEFEFFRYDDESGRKFKYGFRTYSKKKGLLCLVTDLDSEMTAIQEAKKYIEKDNLYNCKDIPSEYHNMSDIPFIFDKISKVECESKFFRIWLDDIKFRNCIYGTIKPGNSLLFTRKLSDEILRKTNILWNIADNTKCLDKTKKIERVDFYIDNDNNVYANIISIRDGDTWMELPHLLYDVSDKDKERKYVCKLEDLHMNAWYNSNKGIWEEL